MLAKKYLRVGFVVLLSLASCVTKDKAQESYVVCDGRSNATTCTVTCQNKNCVFLIQCDEFVDRYCDYSCENGLKGHIKEFTTDSSYGVNVTYDELRAIIESAMPCAPATSSAGVATVLQHNNPVDEHFHDADSNGSEAGQPAPAGDIASDNMNPAVSDKDEAKQKNCRFENEATEEMAFPDDFQIFLTNLRIALTMRDVEFVKLILSEDSLGSFSSEKGREGFMQAWNLDKSDSNFWKSMENALSQGGIKDDVFYVFPYYHAGDIPENCAEFYSPHVTFEKRDGNWVIATFLAGD